MANSKVVKPGKGKIVVKHEPAADAGTEELKKAGRVATPGGRAIADVKPSPGKVALDKS